MDERVWVGSIAHTPEGWVSCESVEALLASALSPQRIVLDDRAAVLREADFARVYAHSPLARIERVVGPWRAGIGRTDPEWPLATTRDPNSVPESGSLEIAPWRPLTIQYDELAFLTTLPDLSGLTCSVEIADSELREMWIHWLEHAGAKLGTHEVDVLIQDGSIHPTERSNLGERSSPTATPACIPDWIVHLRPDPWNAEQRANRLTVRPIEITASVLDSPALVMQRIAAAWKREPA